MSLKKAKPQRDAKNSEAFMKATTPAIVTGKPSVIKTKGGDRSIVYAEVASGDKHAIYRAAGDPEIMGLKEGQEVEISIASLAPGAIGGTGHADLVTRPQMGFSIVPAPEKPPAESQRNIDIKNYVENMGKIYGGCYIAASKQLADTGLDKPEIKDVATTLFIQTARHFNL
jgi:hypothetical protein